MKPLLLLSDFLALSISIILADFCNLAEQKFNQYLNKRRWISEFQGFMYPPVLPVLIPFAWILHSQTVWQKRCSPKPLFLSMWFIIVICSIFIYHASTKHFRNKLQSWNILRTSISEMTNRAQKLRAFFESYNLRQNDKNRSLLGIQHWSMGALVGILFTSRKILRTFKTEASRDSPFFGKWLSEKPPDRIWIQPACHQPPNS